MTHKWRTAVFSYLLNKKVFKFTVFSFDIGSTIARWQLQGKLSAIIKRLPSLYEAKTKTGEIFLFHGLKWSTNLALFLKAWVLQLEISYELGTKRNRKENSSRHNDKQILSVVDVILDIVRDAETISVILTSPLCSLSLLSQWWFHSHSRWKNTFLYIHNSSPLSFSISSDF